MLNPMPKLSSPIFPTPSLRKCVPNPSTIAPSPATSSSSPCSPSTLAIDKQAWDNPIKDEQRCLITTPTQMGQGPVVPHP